MVFFLGDEVPAAMSNIARFLATSPPMLDGSSRGRTEEVGNEVDISLFLIVLLSRLTDLREVPELKPDNTSKVNTRENVPPHFKQKKARGTVTLRLGFCL